MGKARFRRPRFHGCAAIRGSIIQGMGGGSGTPKRHHGEHAQSNPDPHADNPVNTHARAAHRAREEGGGRSAEEHNERIRAAGRDARDDKPSQHATPDAKEHAHAIAGRPQTDVTMQPADDTTSQGQKPAGHARQNAAAWSSSPPQQPHRGKEEQRGEQQRNGHVVDQQRHQATEDERGHRPCGRVPQPANLVSTLRLSPKTRRFSCHRPFSRLPSALPGRALDVFGRSRQEGSWGSHR